MMQLQILSDTHNEYFAPGEYKRSDTGLWNCSIPETDAELVILAGDIDKGSRGVEWAIEESIRLSKPIIYVPGNHEYYGYDMIEILSRMQEICAGTDVHLLNNESFLFKGVRFLGSTLWTDYCADPATTQQSAMGIIEYSLNDHRLIRYGNQGFTTKQALALHQESKEWLVEQLSQPYPGPTVVVTHHGPSTACQHKRFPVSPLSTAFHTDLDELVEKADLWIYGHTHSCLDTVVRGTRLVSNQFGYAYREENPEFNGQFVVEV